jgi:hypothetical protein
MRAQAPEVAAVLARLEKVERQNRRLRGAGIAVFVLAAAGLLMGQAMPKARIVEAEGFQLKDGQGMVRAELVVDKDGPGLHLRDDNGKERAELVALHKAGAELVLRDEDGQGRVWLTALEGGAGLDLEDHGNTRVHLYTRAGGTSLVLSDEKGQGRAKLDVTKDRTWLALFDEKGKSIWSQP